MADEILQVGAIINLSEFLPGLETMASATLSSTATMTSSFTNLGTASAASTAETVTNLGMIPASLSKIDATIGSTAEVAQSGTSKIGAAFRAMSASIMESVGLATGAITGLQERIVGSAEASNLAVGSMGAGFAGLSSLLGAGIVVGFAAHFLDEAAQVEVELGHLEAATGVSITTLAGLRSAVLQTGASFEPVEMALRRMQIAQQRAIEGTGQGADGFLRLGLSLKEVESASPEQLFLKLADAMGKSTNTQREAISAQQVFGRGGLVLVSTMKELEAAAKANNMTLAQYIDKLGIASGINEESKRTAEDWKKMTAELAQTIQSALIPVIDILVKSIKGWEGGYQVAKAAIITASLEIVMAWNRMVGYAEGVGKVIKAAFTPGADVAGVWAKTMSDVDIKNTQTAMKIVEAWGEAKEKIKSIMAVAPELKGPEGPEPKPLTAASTILTQWQAQLQSMKDAEDGFHELSKRDEAKFWFDKSVIARNNADLYASTYHLFREAERATQKESLKEEVDGVEQRVLAEKSGSSNRVAILTEELAHLKAIGADKTEEYRRIQTQLVTATKEATAEDEKALIAGFQKQIDAAKNNVNERIKIIDEAERMAEAIYGKESESYKKFAAERVRAEVEAQNQIKKTKSDSVDTEASHQVAILETQKHTRDVQDEIFGVAASKRIADDIATAEQEKAIELKAIADKEAIYADDPVKYEELEKQKVAITDRYDKQISSLEDESLKERGRRYQAFSQQISSDFAGAVGQMMTSHKSFIASLGEAWNKMLVQWVESLTKMLLQWIAHQAMKVLIEQASQDQQTAVATAGESERSNVGIIETLKGIMRAAAKAAAHAFSWVIQEVPWPVNFALAPIAAAGAFAGVMAFGAAASAAEGALLDRDMLVGAHAKEMILPPKISTGLTNVIDAGGFAAPPAMTQDFVGRSAAVSNISSTSNTIAPTSNINVRMGNITAMDSVGMAEQLHKARMPLARLVEGLVRSGHMELADIVK